MLGKRLSKTAPLPEYWYTLHYDNGIRTEKCEFWGDLNEIQGVANSHSLDSNRLVIVRKNWKEGCRTHYETVSRHKNGRMVGRSW